MSKWVPVFSETSAAGSLKRSLSAALKSLAFWRRRAAHWRAAFCELEAQQVGEPGSGSYAAVDGAPDRGSVLAGVAFEIDRVLEGSAASARPDATELLGHLKRVREMIPIDEHAAEWLADRPGTRSGLWRWLPRSTADEAAPKDAPGP